MTVYTVIVDNVVEKIFLHEEDANKYNKRYSYFNSDGYAGNSWSMVKPMEVEEKYEEKP